MDRHIPTFNELTAAVRHISESATGYSAYPAPYHRILNFQHSQTRQMVRAIADATELVNDVNSINFPNRPYYDLELLDDSDQFLGLSQAVRRAPRFLEDI